MRRMIPRSPNFALAGTLILALILLFKLLTLMSERNDLQLEVEKFQVEIKKSGFHQNEVAAENQRLQSTIESYTAKINELSSQLAQVKSSLQKIGVDNNNLMEHLQKVEKAETDARQMVEMKDRQLRAQVKETEHIEFQKNELEAKLAGMEAKIVELNMKLNKGAYANNPSSRMPKNNDVKHGLPQYNDENSLKNHPQLQPPKQNDQPEVSNPRANLPIPPPYAQNKHMQRQHNQYPDFDAPEDGQIDHPQHYPQKVHNNQQQGNLDNAYDDMDNMKNEEGVDDGKDDYRLEDQGGEDTGHLGDGEVDDQPHLKKEQHPLAKANPNEDDVGHKANDRLGKEDDIQIQKLRLGRQL